MFAEAEFQLRISSGEEGTRYDHLIRQWDATGIMPKDLSEHPVLSSEAAYLWGHFLELHSARGGSGFGPNPIGYRDIRDWMDLTGHELAKWEIRAIRKADAAFMSVQAEITARSKKPT